MGRIVGGASSDVQGAAEEQEHVSTLQAKQ